MVQALNSESVGEATKLILQSGRDYGTDTSPQRHDDARRPNRDTVIAFGELTKRVPVDRSKVTRRGRHRPKMDDGSVSTEASYTISATLVLYVTKLERIEPLRRCHNL